MSRDRGQRPEAGGQERLDLAIDRAVREMLDVEGRADLRARVIARIERPVGSTFKWKILLPLPVAAAAIVVLAVVLTRHGEPPVRPRVAANGSDVRLSAPERVTAAATEKIAVRETPQAPARIAYAASIDAADTASAGIDPLKTIAPINVAPIALDSITPEPIEVRPLNPIPEMQIAPLNPPDRRD
jgi:hypothetical protein